MTRYAVGLGSNLGGRLGYMRAGLEGLAALGEPIHVSSLYETAPVGGPDQDPYLNAVVIIESELSPHELLDRLNELEAANGRTREVRWDSRTLDADLIATDGKPVDDPPRLVVPHPRAGERRFVLAPLSEVWPEAPVARDGETAHVALGRLSGQDVDRLDDRWDRSGDSRGKLWVAGQLVVFAVIGVLLWLHGRLPDGLTIGGVTGGLGIVAAILLMAWSTRALGSNLTAVPEPVASGSLIESGPYRWVRHPIYTAVVLLFASVSVAVHSWSALAVSLLLFGYFTLKSRFEERMLRIAYPGYGAYMKRVKARFIPGLI